MSSTPPTTETAGQAGGGRIKARWPWLAGGGAVVLVALGVLATVGVSGPAVQKSGQQALFKTQRGPLTISVSASGDLSSQQATIIRNQVEEDTTILSLVDQGTLVEKGEVLARLDATSLENEKEQLMIDVESAQAEKITADQQVKITQQQNESNILTARVELRLAKLDFRKYLGAPSEKVNRSDSAVMQRVKKLNSIPLTNNKGYDQQMQAILDKMDGQYKQNVQSGLNDIRIAKAELERTNERLNGSRTLAKKGYITQTELEADLLEQKRLESQLQLARGSLRLQRQFTFQRELANLRDQLEQKQFMLTKAKAEARSNLVEAEANKKSETSQLNQLKTRLAEVKTQIQACTVHAPKDGVVVYVKPDHGWDEMISEGAEIDDRQKMFRLPSSTQMVATVNLHQSVVNKVKRGMPARITTSGDERTFAGEVKKVNRLPDTASSRRASNQKIYKCKILVDSQGALRPGMSVRADILVKRFAEATYVPVQAVVQRQGEPAVFVPGATGPEPRSIKMGLHNSKMVQVTGGLEPGQSVLLTPPLGEEGGNRPQQLKKPEQTKQAESKQASSRDGANAEASPNANVNAGSGGSRAGASSAGGGQG